jgi:hypothetical protein
MPAVPNQPDPNFAGVRKATDRLNNVETPMLAADIRTEGHEQIVLGCASCSAYSQQRVTVPNSVVMDALAAPYEDENGTPLDGEALAERMFRDERITAKTSADPVPHPPSSDWQPRHLMQRAVDMTNAGLIPFSPFGSFVVQDGMRDRPIFAEWQNRYLDELPSTSTLTVVETAPPELPAAEPVNVADMRPSDLAADLEAGWEAEHAAAEPVDEPPADPYPADGNARAINRWVGDDRNRAAEAHQRELERDRPRSTVVKHTEQLLAQ